MKDKVKHITQLLAESHGIDVSKHDDLFLFKSFQNKISEKSFTAEIEYLEHLKKNKDEASIFFNSLHNSYSQFFRNPLTYTVLERLVIPTLIQNRKQKEIRIWSAACAAGQEPYSLAILLEEFKNDNKSALYRIFATDQSEANLILAEKGKYENSALDNVSLKRTKQWFTCKDEMYAVKPVLKKRIDFSVFDLFDEEHSSPASSIFGNFDIVMCANLLFYYKDQYRKQILKKMKNSMAANGYLVTGEAEREIVMNYGFKEVYPQSAIFRV